MLLGSVRRSSGRPSSDLPLNEELRKVQIEFVIDINRSFARHDVAATVVANDFVIGDYAPPCNIDRAIPDKHARQLMGRHPTLFPLIVGREPIAAHGLELCRMQIMGDFHDACSFTTPID